MRRNKTRRDENDLTGNRVEKSVITDTNHDGTFSAATDRDSVTQYTQDANDRMLSESTVVDGSATESTVYGYTATQQTSKTVTDNTTSSVTSALNYTYDLQGRMSRAVTVAGNRTSDVSYLYGTDGIRISAREDVHENGSTSTRITSYLIDGQNHTGYQQVLQETVTDGTGNLIQKIVYSIGHDHISQSTWRAGDVNPPSVAVFHFDGHGNTRILTDLAGSIVTLAGLLQVYHYDAYGNALNFTMSAAATQYLYSGEQFDPRIGQQYLRARYYDSATGTFNRLDPFFGNKTDPQSFHKYLYTHGDPVTGVDPTGRSFSVPGLLGAISIGASLTAGVAYVAGASTSEIVTAAVIGGIAGALFFFHPMLALRLMKSVLVTTGFGLLVQRFRQPVTPLAANTKALGLEYAELAKNCYSTEPNTANGWVFEERLRSDQHSGYFGKVFTRGNEVAICYAGTDDIPDIAADIYQGTAGGGAEYDLAIEDARRIIDKPANQGKQIVFVGHSLGGGLATAAAAIFQRRAITYNAAGVHPSTVSAYGATLNNIDQLVDAFRVQGEILSTLQDSPLGIGFLMPDSNGTAHWLAGNPDHNSGTRHKMGDSVIPALNNA